MKTLLLKLLQEKRLLALLKSLEKVNYGIELFERGEVFMRFIGVWHKE